jgi:hypothetical protein
MRKREGYTFNFDQGQQIYRFTSSGPNGDIQKIAVISPAYSTAWNFAFGDANDDADGFDDEAITNNGDMPKVVQTLANIIYDFLEAHADLQVILHPVDEKRHYLYNRVIQRNFDEFN